MKLNLICMPFQLTGISSLSIALLATYIRENGFEVEESYFHFKFSEIFGLDRYAEIANSGPNDTLVGELLFSEALHGEIKDETVSNSLNRHFGKYDERRRKIKEFGNYCLGQLRTKSTEIIGFTTSSNQLLPSIWLSQLIKKQMPHVRIVLGGSACSQPMGQHIFNHYKEVDYIVSGFGEAPLLNLVSGKIPASRQLIENTESVDLNTLPIPNYDSFIEQANAHKEGMDFMLAFESSRGCWWGEKNHCKFCGLNQLGLNYNAKDTNRMVEEIRSLWDRYGKNMFATDTILSRTHLNKALPRLASFETKPELFYEIKANMKEKEMELFDKAGIHWVQPGIESLNSRLLKLLNKGASSLQNLALLKWCRERNIKVSWNVLCDIPGEHLEDYQEMMALMDKVHHFIPPFLGPIRVDRYSPYFKEYEKYGWKELRPLSPYRHLHPTMSKLELHQTAYHFEGVGGSPLIKSYFKDLENKINKWHERYKAGDGLFWDENHGLVKIADGQAGVIRRTPLLDVMINTTHDITKVSDLLSIDGVNEELVEQFCDQGFFYRESGKLINLAVRVGMAS